MPITYELKGKDDLLIVVSSGVCDDLDQLKEYVLDLHEAATTLEQTRILVDETQLEYRLSTINSYYSGEFMSEIAPKPYKIAVVCRQEGWDDTKFWETVAVNRGVPVRVFADKDRAEEWVRE
jgi:hypothetical protein